jgi:hypothetical protein
MHCMEWKSDFECERWFGMQAEITAVASCKLSSQHLPVETYEKHQPVS